MKVQRFAGNFKPTYWSEKVQKELEKLEILKKSLMQQYFG